jgi:hypothetical protein
MGANYLTTFQVQPDGSPSVEFDNGNYDVLPLFGGGAQWKLAGLGGDEIDFGLEGMLSFSARSNLQAFASSGGTTVVAFDVDLLLVEVYGGPFVSEFVADGVRLYAAAGPLLQWVGYDQSDGTTTENVDGTGGGVYARGGIEFPLPSGRLLGMGVRWSESSIDFQQGFGTADLEGLQVYVSYSYGPGEGRTDRNGLPWP